MAENCVVEPSQNWHIDPITIFTDEGLSASFVTTANTNIRIISPVEIAGVIGWQVPAPLTTWDMCGLLPKLLMPLLAPYTDNIFVDADTIIRKDTWDPWAVIDMPSTRPKSCMTIPGLADASNLGPAEWHWGHLHDVSRRVGFAVPQIYATLMRYEPMPDTVCEAYKVRVASWLKKPQDLGICRLFRGGYPDEIFFALWIGCNSERPDEKAHQETRMSYFDACGGKLAV